MTNEDNPAPPAPAPSVLPTYPSTVWEVLAWIQVYRERIFIRCETFPHTRPLTALPEVEATRWIAEALIRWAATGQIPHRVKWEDAPHREELAHLAWVAIGMAL